MSVLNSRLVVLWFVVATVLVTWDAIYCLGRPYTMKGGILHWPLYVPYELYAEVDYIYGQKAYDNHNGFTNAQSALNVIELLMQIWYLRLRTKPGKENKALMVGYTVSVMSLSKTILYWLQEYFSGYAEVGHNSLERLIFLWIIPNGAWIVVPGILVKAFGAEIMQKLNSKDLKRQ